jgi:FkbM family methyltransferase
MRLTIQRICLGAYSLARRTGLLTSRLGQGLFVPVYFFYKRVSEAPWVDLIGALAEPGSLVVDVGANIGFFTLPLSRAVGPAGKVLAFEPDPDNLDMLGRALTRAGCANVDVVAAALGDKDGTVAFYLNADHPTDHRIYPAEGHQPGPAVALRSLDAYLAENPSGRALSLVKIDVQGAELLVLRGMRKTLAAQPKARLIMEFCPEMLAACGTPPEELIAFLKELGFSAYSPRRGASPALLTWEQVARSADADGYVDLLFSRQPLPAPAS